MKRRRKLSREEQLRIASEALEQLPELKDLKGLRAEPRPRLGPRIGGWRRQIKPPWAQGNDND